MNINDVHDVYAAATFKGNVGRLDVTINRTGPHGAGTGPEMTGYFASTKN